MDRNSSHGMLKLILAGVVLTLIVVLASYMNLNKAASTSGDALLKTAITDGKVFASMQPGGVVLGTNMTPNQVRWYVARNTSAEVQPAWYQCPVFGIMRSTVNAQSDTVVMSWVNTMESNNYDFPNKEPWLGKTFCGVNFPA